MLWINALPLYIRSGVLRAAPKLPFLLCLTLLVLSREGGVKARKNKNAPHNKVTSADIEIIHEAPTSTTKKVAATPAHSHSTSKSSKSKSTGGEDGEFSIEDVDQEKIEELIREGTKNLVVLFYDGRVKCPSCSEALSEVEEIDDDLEATGYIEVVKTDDRRVARANGIQTFPALVYFRRSRPIVYDGDFKDSQVLFRWLRAHDEVVTWELTDDNFEAKTDSYSPDEGALDWLVMFFDSEEPDCNAFIPTLETVAHRLRGLVNVGSVDTSVADDVAERFRIDADNQCPTFLLFHRGKMYRFNDPAKDVKSIIAFVLHKFKDQRGHRVPEPPTALEHFYEQAKEKFLDIVEDTQALGIIIVGSLLLLVTLALLYKAYRIKQQQRQHIQEPREKKGN